MEGGRCLLASSHAGTRLPIADLIQSPGRSPSARRLLADLPATPAYAAARDHLLHCLDTAPTITEAPDVCQS